MSHSQQIQSVVAGLVVPSLNKSLGTARMLSSVKEDERGVTVEIQLPTPAFPDTDSLRSLIQDAVRPLAGEQPITVEFASVVRGRDTGGRVGLNIHNIIAVGSGKGGVGKSTVAAALACGLHSLGCRTGLMDADVYGPSIPHMMSATGRPAATELEDGQGGKVVRMEPIDVQGLKLMSMGFFIEEGQSVIWRGPMLHKALTQFLKDTQWGELDYLIIDLPPGTGDVSLTLAQQVGLAGAVIVCTPQQVALLDAVKAVDMYRKVNVPVLGFVENMVGPIFGQGGVAKAAQQLNVPFLGEIPMEACIREYSDRGEIMKMLTDPNPARDAFRNVSQQVALQVVREILAQPSGPTLEIL
ncbi:MAG: Mrp/NBP35 family ATP-binding protein [Planctomycetaceae bacterium]|nr:Mrp/NBP35 family ATP-binding protein [Planctomycetaceae bacterium]